MNHNLISFTVHDYFVAENVCQAVLQLLTLMYSSIWHMIGKLPQVFSTETSYNRGGNNNCVNSLTRKCTFFPGTESQIKESISISHP